MGIVFDRYTGTEVGYGRYLHLQAIHGNDTLDIGVTKCQVHTTWYKVSGIYFANPT